MAWLRAYRVVIPAALLFVVHLPLSLAAEGCTEWAARLVSLQGRVERRALGGAAWTQARTDARLCPGDALRTGANSRAAVLLQNETLVRLDQLTTVNFPEPAAQEQNFLLDIIDGVGFFFSRTPKRLEFRSPFVNAAVEGTEFIIAVAPREARVLVLDGVIRASNAAGELRLASGEGAVAGPGEAPRRILIADPSNAVKWALHYPPVIYHGVRELDPSVGVTDSVRAFDRGDVFGALSELDRIPGKARTASFHSYRASILLYVGRVEAAQVDLEAALKRDPENADAFALQSIVALVLNRPDQAYRLARRAADSSPRSAAPQIALSYVHQSRFDLEQARESARTATERDPLNALAWARLAELDLALGDLDAAHQAAATAESLNPRLSRTQTTLGFAELLRFDTEKAANSFGRAIELDQADPLPRLGLGISKIRRGNLKEGRRDIEIAATIDPASSIVRSYLGKAYFDEKRDALASTEYRVAKDFDPRDPTPWFYNAILEQTQNRPVKALQDLDRSIMLNDNRAVYRSSLLLDTDLAARSASLARIYGDLGFQQRALVEGWNSVNADPGNWSAHRLLADTYAQQPRQNIARTSELFQSLMYQPINTLPLQPQAQESSLPIVAQSGPTDVALNEFHSLFTRDGANLLVDGAIGNNDTWGNNLVAYGTHRRLSYSFGQFHYETNGFRENNDQSEDIYNAFVQVAVLPNLSIQAELRRRESDHGDLEMRFDPDLFSPTLRRAVTQDVGRFGLRFAPNRRSTLLASVLYADREGDQAISRLGQPIITEGLQVDGYQGELQYLYRGDRINLIAGGAWSSLDWNQVTAFDWTPSFGVACPPSPPFPPVPCESATNTEPKYGTGYGYVNISYPTPVIWTLGLSHDDVEDEPLETRRTNPKMGLQWDLTESLRVRGAYFETVKRTLIVEQTLEPTQVAGFTQFFDDVDGTEARNRGIGLDWKLPNRVFLGAETIRRNVREPGFSGDDVEFSAREDDVFQGYLYWAPHERWALSAAYRYENTDSDVFEFGFPNQVRTESVPLTVRYFNPSGFFGEFGATWVDQQVLYTRPDEALPEDEPVEDSFLVVDVAVGYRLPQRRGIFSLEVHNLFDEDFFYQDDNYRTSEPVAPRYIPDRTIVGKLSLNF